MGKIKLLILAALLALPVVGVSAAPAGACMGPPCDQINQVCEALGEKFFGGGGQCLG